MLTRFNSTITGKFEDEPTCGRPLGMRINKEGYLVVLDAYLGLFQINVATGECNCTFVVGEGAQLYFS